MRKKLIILILILMALCIPFAAFAGAQTTALTQAVPPAVINNFGKDPEISRNFTWHSTPAAETGSIEYCIKDQFHGFDGANIIRAAAKNYNTKTDLDNRVIHKVELNNLKPGTEYVYRVGSEKGGFSSSGVFKTAGQDVNQFTFINITDTQGETEGDYALWRNTLDKAIGYFPDAGFLVLTGDMVDKGDAISQWELFTGAVRNELMNIPVVPVVGNHDVMDGNQTNPDAKNFTDRFDLPAEQDTGAPSGTVYSFDYGNTHIAVMNTQCGSENFEKQADWLRRDMSETKKLWKIVALHRGPYGGIHDSADIREAWTPVFDELDIDLVLQGHDHNYVRSYSMKNNTKVKAGEGTLYLVGNTGGVKFYPLAQRSWQAVDLQPNTQMYIAVTINNNKMIIGAYDVKNNLRDSVTLAKVIPPESAPPNQGGSGGAEQHFGIDWLFGQLAKAATKFYYWVAKWI